MTRFGSALLALLFILLAGCHEADDMNGSRSVPPGAMSYSGYDNSGRLVVTGWIQLDIVPLDATPNLSVSGTWSLQSSADPALIGPQNGSGVLAGTLVEEGLRVDLSPGDADDNVELTGTINLGGTPLHYEGNWVWITFTGVRASGTFRATQSSPLISRTSVPVSEQKALSCS